MAGTAASGKGKLRACTMCSERHQRKLSDLCKPCERSPDGLGLPPGGHWQPGRHGILRWVS
jgi:hypothetical protein